jgi:hypothetical protein
MQLTAAFMSWARAAMTRTAIADGTICRQTRLPANCVNSTAIRLPAVTTPRLATGRATIEGLETDTSGQPA